MTHVGKFLDKVSSFISRTSAASACVCIVMMAIMITVNAMMRFIFNKPMAFVEEYSGFLFVFIVFMGLSYITRKDLHISVDLFYIRLSKKVQHITDVITTLLSLVVVAIYFFFSLQVFIQNLRVNEVSVVTYTPLWIPKAFVSLGLLWFILEIVNRLINKLGVPRGSME